MSITRSIPQLDLRVFSEKEIQEALFIAYPDLEFFDFYKVVAKKIVGRTWYPTNLTLLLVKCWGEQKCKSGQKNMSNGYIRSPIDTYLPTFISVLSKLGNNQSFLASWMESWQQDM